MRYSHCVTFYTQPASELLATGTDKELDEHFTRSLEYSKSFSEAGVAGVEVWVINFTRADDTLSNPHWQSNEQAADGLNVMHIWHDMNFKTIKMRQNKGVNQFRHVYVQPYVFCLIRVLLA